MRTDQEVAVITGVSQGIGADALVYAQERGCGKADELTRDYLDDHRSHHAYVNHPGYLE